MNCNLLNQKAKYSKVQQMIYRRMLYIFAIINEITSKCTCLVAWEKHTHMITSKWFRFIIAKKYTLASFADVLWAFISAHQRLYGVWNSFPENRPITTNFPYFGKLAFDLCDLRADVSINLHFYVIFIFKFYKQYLESYP